MLKISCGLGNPLILALCLHALFHSVNIWFVCLFLHICFEGEFHKVLFLAPGGKTVFQGTLSEAENYFNRFDFEDADKVNPADFYMDAIGKVVTSRRSDFTSLPVEWNRYVSQNSAGGSAGEERDGNATGVPDSPVTRQGTLPFNNSAGVLIRKNQVVTTYWL